MRIVECAMEKLTNVTQSRFLLSLRRKQITLHEWRFLVFQSLAKMEFKCKSIFIFYVCSVYVCVFALFFFFLPVMIALYYNDGLVWILIHEDFNGETAPKKERNKKKTRLHSNVHAFCYRFFFISIALFCIHWPIPGQSQWIFFAASIDSIWMKIVLLYISLSLIDSDILYSQQWSVVFSHSLFSHCLVVHAHDSDSKKKRFFPVNSMVVWCSINTQWHGSTFKVMGKKIT